MDEENFKYIVCPSCNTGIEENLLKESGNACIECGNTDWSEEAYKIPKDHRKENCVECGKLLDMVQDSVTGFHTYTASYFSPLPSRVVRKYRDKQRLGWLYFCKRHDPGIKPKLIDKIIAGDYFAFPITAGLIYLGEGGFGALNAFLEGHPDLMAQYFVEAVKNPSTTVLAVGMGIGVTLYQRSKNRRRKYNLPTDSELRQRLG